MSEADFKDKNGVGGRIGRYGRVSTTMAGLAARLAGEKFLGMKIDRGPHAAQLTQALGNLKGPLMKVGQILATIPEALPPEYAEEFQKLQASAPPMGWPFVKRRMKTELGPEWESHFADFQHEAVAAASLGQVHQAHAHDGTLLACKLQYPDMGSAIEADLRQLKVIFSVFEAYDKAISTKYIHQELAARLREELDYKREAKHCALYDLMLKDVPQVHVPKVYPELSTERLLSATWLEGRPLMSFIDDSEDVRNTIAMNLFQAWYVPLYYYGVIHGDPHMGNYSIREDYSLNLLDFGCVRVFPSAFVGGVIDLYHALMNGDEPLAMHAFETWGFKGLNKEQFETLKLWAKFLYAPLMEDKVRPIGEVTNGVYGRETAQHVHAKLREVGGVTVPREFVFMDRAALGLGSVFLHLKARINWYRVFNEMIEGFNAKELERKQLTALQSVGLGQE